MRRGWGTVLVLLLAGALIVGVWWFGLRPHESPTDMPAPAAAPTAPARPAEAFPMIVESVHDGDTIRAHVDTPNDVVTDLASTRIRLLGIDTPEISPELDCWGAEATTSLAELLPPGSTVWAAPDVEVLDQYGRHLLYLWTDDGRFVNAELLAQGDARVEIYRPNTLHEGLFRSLEAEAQAAHAGRWGACA